MAPLGYVRETAVDVLPGTVAVVVRNISLWQARGRKRSVKQLQAERPNPLHETQDPQWDGSPDPDQKGGFES